MTGFDKTRLKAAPINFYFFVPAGPTLIEDRNLQVSDRSERLTSNYEHKRSFISLYFLDVIIEKIMPKGVAKGAVGVLRIL